MTPQYRVQNTYQRYPKHILITIAPLPMGDERSWKGLAETKTRTQRRQRAGNQITSCGSHYLIFARRQSSPHRGHSIKGPRPALKLRTYLAPGYRDRASGRDAGRDAGRRIWKPRATPPGASYLRWDIWSARTECLRAYLFNYITNAFIIFICEQNKIH